MASDIQGLLDFVALTHTVREIKRDAWVKGEETFENDSEHSFQLALVSLYVIEENKLDLDPYRAMSIAIVHDIVEAHSGDTPIFGSETDRSTKEAKETAAIERLREDWPSLHAMHELINEYQSKSSPEARFVYALDKLVPTMNNYLDNGRNWKRQKVDLDHVMAIKVGKINLDPTVDQYYKQLLELLRANPNLL